MNPVNATSLFVSATRSVLQCDPRDPRALAELCKLLPFFRQSLSCLVCGNLLQNPIAPTDSSCQHYVCLGCKGQRMQLKPSCSWCKDYSRFEENQQLSLLVHCYRKLCLYIAHSPLAPHIAAAATDSPDLQAVLNEGLMMAENEPDTQDEADSPTNVTSRSEMTQTEAPTLKEVKEEPNAISINGLHECNGLPPSDRQQPLGVETKQGGFSEELCVTTATGRGAGLCGLIEDELKPGEGPLLLSVEEVLRTLDPPLGPPLNGPALLQSDTTPLPFNQSEQSPALGSNPLVQSESNSVLAPFRCHRKRSRSESDSEKLSPLPLSLLRGGPHFNPVPKQEPQYMAISPLPHLAPVPNGGPPKVGKTVLVPHKTLKKTVEHHSSPKKACVKARQGAPKPRPQPRIPPHPHTHPLSHPPSPSKPIYKKPPEKKGCKCGRATQNPSVLTCRGQRCPCYSNRKACLDCICRGCQNSYMANGEKKLEAFAVPEKALEQTRLTLGINLTSITAAALRSPTTAAPGNALLNVTTATGAPVTAAFLSGAGHDNRAFDDSLEMRFDC